MIKVKLGNRQGTALLWQHHLELHGTWSHVRAHANKFFKGGRLPWHYCPDQVYLCVFFP